MLYDLHKICKLVTNLMSKFIRKKVLAQNSQENVSINVLKVENHKSKKNVEIGVKARLLLGEPNLVSRENQDALTKSVPNFIQQQQNICSDICPLMCLLFVMQFLHPEKRNNSGATNAISNLSLRLKASLENKLSVVSGTNDTKERICDKIRKQWMAYQNEPLPEIYYLCHSQPILILEVCLRKVWIATERNKKFTLQEN